MNHKTTPLLLLLLVCCAFKLPDPEPVKIWLIGDSTMSIKETNTYPETGWGMPFVYFFDSTVVVDNRAKNGRSTSSFIREGLWKPVTENMKAGDYVLIQFGHNDEVKTKKTYTTETEFKGNLTRYVNDSKAKKAIPVLITPVARRSFNADGKMEDSHALYAALVREVAAEQQVPLIDLDKESTMLLEQMGFEGSKVLFNHLTKGEHPNYPDGKEDNTHFNELGARKMAELVLNAIRIQLPDLAKRVVKRP